MTIYMRGNSFVVSVGSEGNRYRESFKDRTAADLAHAQATARLKATGSPLEAPQRPSIHKGEGKVLGDAFKLAWSLRWSQDKHPETHRYNCNSLFRIISERTPLADIDTDAITECCLEWSEDDISGSTINKRMNHLNVMLKLAHERGWIDKVPKPPKFKQSKHRVRWLDDAEEAKVLAKCQELGLTDLHDFVIVAIDTGFRRSELLNFRNADFMNGQLHLHEGETKNDRSRTIPASDRVRLVLQRRGSMDRPFGDVLNIRNLRSQWQRVRASLGLSDDPQFVVHMLRHTCASRLVQNGVALIVVQQWMGHQDIQTTMRYSHLAPDALSSALQVLNKRNGQADLKVVNG